jgi:hypothetical protein
MLNQIATYALYALGTVLFFRYIVRIKIVANEQDYQAEFQNLKMMDRESKKLESECASKKQEVCLDFSHSVSPLFGKYFNFEKIMGDMERFKERLLCEKAPLLSTHEAWEIFKMMETVDKLYALLQESLRTKSKKKKTELMDRFYDLKESLKGYKLPYACGALLDDKGIETNNDPEDLEESRQEEGTFCTNWNMDGDSTSDPKIAHIVDAMFQNIPAKASMADSL